MKRQEWHLCFFADQFDINGGRIGRQNCVMPAGTLQVCKDLLLDTDILRAQRACVLQAGQQQHVAEGITTSIGNGGRDMEVLTSETAHTWLYTQEDGTSTAASMTRSTPLKLS